MCRALSETSALSDEIELFDGLCRQLARRQPDTWAHSLRVSRYASWLAARLELSSASLLRCQRGALLHDFGKLFMAREVHKSAPLDAQELRRIREHPDLGFDFLRRFEVLQRFMPVVLEHHERWDGEGYPRALRHEAISVEARVVAIADSYDAMVSDRPYRRGMGAVHALDELLSESGRQFDPELVSTFVTRVAGNRLDRDARLGA